MNTNTAAPAVESVATAPMRLTARGRRLRGLATLLLVVAVVMTVFAFGSQAFAGDDAPGTQTYVEVRAGESLWSVASRVAPDHDPRDAVADIKTANRLSDSVVQAGTRLLIPSTLL